MIKYNPMSKEFQEEANRLGITGTQLVAKYKKEGKSFDKGQYVRRRNQPKEYTDEQLLWYLTQFYEKYGRPPTAKDFDDSFEYPNSTTYQRRFESWSNALKLVGLDVESMVKKGIVETDDQKARFGEIIVREHFRQHSVDLAGDNKNSLCDGICPNGLYYDVKSSALSIHRWNYKTDNKEKDKIEIYYFLAFNEDWTKLEYGWKVPGKIVERNSFQVVLNRLSRAKITFENMKEYDITEKLREILIKYGYFEKITNYRKAREKGMTIYEYDKQLYDGCIIVE